ANETGARSGSASVKSGAVPDGAVPGSKLSAKAGVRVGARPPGPTTAATTTARSATTASQGHSLAADRRLALDSSTRPAGLGPGRGCPQPRLPPAPPGA